MPKGIPGSSLDRQLAEAMREAEEAERIEREAKEAKGPARDKVAKLLEMQAEADNKFYGAAVRVLVEDGDTAPQRRVLAVASKVIERQKTKAKQEEAKQAFNRLGKLKPVAKPVDDAAE